MKNCLCLFPFASCFIAQSWVSLPASRVPLRSASPLCFCCLCKSRCLRQGCPVGPGATNKAEAVSTAWLIISWKIYRAQTRKWWSADRHGYEGDEERLKRQRAKGQCTRRDAKRDEGERKSYGMEEQRSARQRFDIVDTRRDKKGEVNRGERAFGVIATWGKKTDDKKKEKKGEARKTIRCGTLYYLVRVLQSLFNHRRWKWWITQLQPLTLAFITSLYCQGPYLNPKHKIIKQKIEDAVEENNTRRWNALKSLQGLCDNPQSAAVFGSGGRFESRFFYHMVSHLSRVWHLLVWASK